MKHFHCEAKSSFFYRVLRTLALGQKSAFFRFLLYISLL